MYSLRAQWRAITLSGNLIEFTLKHAAFVKEAGGYQNYDPDKWDQFEKIDFSDSIGRAKRAGLLDSKWGSAYTNFARTSVIPIAITTFERLRGM